MRKLQLFKKTMKWYIKNESKTNLFKNIIIATYHQESFVWMSTLATLLIQLFHVVT